MKTFHDVTAIIVLSAAAAATASTASTTYAQPFRDAPAAPLPQYDGNAQEGVDYDVLLHGVVHEAFVEPAAESIEPITVDRQPPELIEEQPPEVKPEGNRVTWIPGYWAWDVVREGENGAEDTLDYVWVSGLWRDVPPDREWVPGQWVRVETGYQWSPGYWQLLQAETAQPQVNYLPAPPASIDRGPNIRSPGDDCFWIPGQWTFRHGSYVWNPGFWARQQTGWVWSPARYVCTPHGHVFVDGYWDYEPVSRGQLFGVVVFNRPVYRHVGFRYRPCHAISSSHLLTHLFVSRRGCFYYGNHYTAHHRAHGYRPWYECSRQWHRTSPMVSYYRWQDSCHGRDFDHRMQSLRLSVQISSGRTRTFAEASRHGHGPGRHHGHPVTTVAAIQAAKANKATGKGKGKNAGKYLATRPNGARHEEHGHADSDLGKGHRQRTNELATTRPMSGATKKALLAQEAKRQESRSRAEKLLAAARSGASGDAAKAGPQTRPGRSASTARPAERAAVSTDGSSAASANSRRASAIAAARDRLSSTKPAIASPAKTKPNIVPSVAAGGSSATSRRAAALRNAASKSQIPSSKATPSIARPAVSPPRTATSSPLVKPVRTSPPSRSATPSISSPSGAGSSSRSIQANPGGNSALSSRFRSRSASSASRAAPKPRAAVATPKPQSTRKSIRSAPRVSQPQRSQPKPAPRATTRPSSRPSNKAARPSRSRSSDKKDKKR